MTTEEKIDQIHQAVTGLQADMRANLTICNSKHAAIDDRIHGLHRVIKGNGQPGLEQKHDRLTQRFDRFEAKVLAWVGVGTAVGSIAGPAIIDFLRGAGH